MKSIAHALKLLRMRDYTIAGLRKNSKPSSDRRLRQFSSMLIQKKFLNDRRFAENYVARRKDRGASRLRQELIDKVFTAEMADEILSNADFPSLKRLWQIK